MNTDLFDFGFQSRELFDFDFTIPESQFFSFGIFEDPCESVSMKISSKKANHLKGWDAKPLA